MVNSSDFEVKTKKEKMEEVFVNNNEKKPTKLSVRTNLVRTVKPEKKGQMIDIVAELVNIELNTLGEYKRITFMAKNKEKMEKN